MLGDLAAGLDALAADPDVDAGTRIGAMGLSMGATHAYWLAALDDRVAAVAHRAPSPIWGR
jgi:dipeptidyl aminopeptidase/acylaminoacyl peptidase